MRHLALVLGLVLVCFAPAMAHEGHKQPVPAPAAEQKDARPEVLQEVDRLKSYAREIKAHRDALEQAVTDLRLYAQRLEKAIQDRDQEIQALKATSK